MKEDSDFKRLGRWFSFGRALWVATVILGAIAAFAFGEGIARGTFGAQISDHDQRIKVLEEARRRDSESLRRIESGLYQIQGALQVLIKEGR